jgi:hypothetical protein
MSGVQKTSSALGKVSGAVVGNRLTLKELMAGGGWRIIHDGNLLWVSVITGVVDRALGSALFR